SPRLMPLPEPESGAMHALLFAAPEAPRPAPPPPKTVPARDLIRAIEAPARPSVPDMPEMDAGEAERLTAQTLGEIVADPAAGAQPLASLYQDFVIRLRMRGLSIAPDLAWFRRRLAIARAGISEDCLWSEALALGETLPEEMLAPFLRIARAAQEGALCPEDGELAALYGTSSTGRVRWLLATMEEKGLIASRVDLSGKRTISLPHLGWQTAAAVADPARPSRLGRMAQRETLREEKRQGRIL
ncbi:MAG: ATP-binding protein, partial [Alphaproteobacteria bacterium]|nr:ATP-binding protein [Alphaproteobacteria bacterium]